MTTEPRTEAQMRISSMLMAIECALDDLFPNRVFSTGSFWQRRIAIWINDLEEMVIDYTAEDGIRVYIARRDTSSESSDSGESGGGPSLPRDANIDDIQNYIKGMVVYASACLHLDPNTFARKIYEVAQDAPRLIQTASIMEPAKIPDPFQPS